MAYTMKGAPMKRNFGIDAKNGPTMYNTKKSGVPNVNDKVAKAKKTIGAIKGTMSKAELRSWVIANNKGKPASDKSRTSQAEALSIWRASQPKNTKETAAPVAKTETVVKEPVVPVVKEPVATVVKKKPVVTNIVEDTTPTTSQILYGGNPTLQPGYGKKKKPKKIIPRKA